MIIGITGTIGAGKGTIVSYLEKKGFRHVSVSDFLADVAKERGIEATRIARRTIGNEYRTKSKTALIEAVLADVNPLKEHIVVESLHTASEVEYVRSLGGTIISIDAPLSVRYERIVKRGSMTDQVSLEEFVLEEKRQLASDDPNENNLIASISLADIHLENNGSPQELYQAIDDILERLI
ncbi:MAG: AAA family ATPase [Patescibacteria group bacterium]